jgi:hypothetical protein
MKKNIPVFLVVLFILPSCISYLTFEEDIGDYRVSDIILDIRPAHYGVPYREGRLIPGEIYEIRPKAVLEDGSVLDHFDYSPLDVSSPDGSFSRIFHTGEYILLAASDDPELPERSGGFHLNISCHEGRASFDKSWSWIVDDSAARGGGS